MALFGKFLDPNSQIWSNIVEILTRSSTLANKKFLWKRSIPKVCTFGPTLTPGFPLKMVEIEKNRSAEKLLSLGYPIMSKSRLYHHSPLGENLITFCNIWAIFSRKKCGVTRQRVRIKIWQILFDPHDASSLFL